MYKNILYIIKLLIYKYFHVFTFSCLCIINENSGNVFLCIIMYNYKNVKNKKI